MLELIFMKYMLL